jgi:hypothetical protein
MSDNQQEDFLRQILKNQILILEDIGRKTPYPHIGVDIKINLKISWGLLNNEGEKKEGEE